MNAGSGHLSQEGHEGHGLSLEHDGTVGLWGMGCASCDSRLSTDPMGSAAPGSTVCPLCAISTRCAIVPLLPDGV